VAAADRRLTLAACCLLQIHPSLVINVDQTGLHLLPSANFTYEKKGAAAVAVLGAEDKRQITACLASSMHGDLLPLQLIFTGTTSRCHPPATDNSGAAGVHITHSANHWSSLETMQEWVTQVLLPYAERCITNLKLRSDSHMVLMLDVWSVHKGEPFRRFLRTHHPRVHLVFIPANCTSKLQVADVALQRPFKSSIRRSFDAWAAAVLHQQIMEDGIVSLKEHFGMAKIKPLLLQWCVESWTSLQKNKLTILQGWGKCVTSLYDAHDPLKRMDAMREVALQELDPAVEPEGDELEEEDLEEEEEDVPVDMDIQTSDEEKDVLDVSRPIAEPTRRGTRERKQPAAAAGSYLINSQQIALTEDSEA
jgi:hypothetical protein